MDSETLVLFENQDEGEIWGCSFKTFLKHSFFHGMAKLAHLAT
jgi:hypothetical protein